MARIRLFEGADGGAAGTVELLCRSGHEVESGPIDPQALKSLRATPPDAVVIDLARGFSVGRDLAMWLRQAKSTRGVPIVFLNGPPQKLERLKKQLPDATFAPSRHVRSAVRKAIANPPTDPVRPESALAGYSGTPLPKKLGIKPGAVLALVNPPDGFVEDTLGPLPDGVVIRTNLRKTPDLIIWFARSLADVEQRIEAMERKVGRDGIWIAWLKKASGAATDVTQSHVRRIGLANGLVDYKICAIDASWSGLKFTRRK